MAAPIYIVDLFKDIVNAVSTALTPTLQIYDSKITGVHYQHGHPLEILKKLQRMKGAKVYDKYPVIGLFEDIHERKGYAPGFYADADLHLIIARGTEQEYDAEERYDKNFKPVLDPIYQELMNQITLSRKFEFTTPDNQYQHDFYRRVFWGKEGLYGVEGNVFDDRLDAIEIRNLKLRVKSIC